MSGVLDVAKMRDYQRKFVADRDWEQFHNPKNLTMALAGEAGELTELFQWLSEQQSFDVMQDAAKAEQVRDEIADILYYLIRLSDRLDIDLHHAFWEKMAKNEKKYPVALAKGNAKKYTELNQDS